MLKQKIFFALFSLLAAFPISVFAQETPFSGEKNNTVVVATVDIYNARLEKQDGNTLHLAFDIKNGSGAQAQVRYGVTLLKKVGESYVQLDKKAFEKMLSISENQTIPVSLVYNAPIDESGTYNVKIEAVNDSALPLGQATVKDIEITTNKKEYLEFVPNTCGLVPSLETKKEGLKKEDIFLLDSGVDVAKEETLSLGCQVQNTFSQEKKVTARFETRKRSLYGGVATDVEPLEEQSFVIASHEKKSIVIRVPKALAPQSYTAVVHLEGDGVESRGVDFRYVVRGLSGTIQNLVFDKDVYNRGDVANLSIFYSLSADNFPGARGGEGSKLGSGTITVGVLDGKGNVCSEKKQVSVNDTMRTTIQMQVPIQSVCMDPKANVVFMDGKGNVLDSQTYAVTTAPTASGTNVAASQTQNFLPLLVIAVLVVLVALVIMVFFWKKRMRRGMMGVLLFLGLTVGFLVMGGGEANADTLVVYDNAWGNASMTYNVWLSGTSLAPSQGFTANATGYWSSCNNRPACCTSLTAGNSNGQSGTLFSNAAAVGSCANPQTHNVHYCYWNPWGGIDADWDGFPDGEEVCYDYSYTTCDYYYVSFSAPATAGSYYTTFTAIMSNEYTDTKSANIWYTVTNPTTNGVCGASNGAYLTSAPTSGLCSSGTASAVTGTWSWTCYGSYGGANASCSAKAIPKGGVAANCNDVWGWSCDASNYTQSSDIHLWEHRWANDWASSQFRGYFTPNKLWDYQWLADACGGNKWHGGSWTIPDSLKTGDPRMLSAYAIDIPLPSQYNPWLNNITVDCVPPVTNLQATCSPNGTQATFTWNAAYPGKSVFAIRMDKGDGKWWYDGTPGSQACPWDPWWVTNIANYSGDYCGMKNGNEGLSFTAAVTPGVANNFWVHAYSGGVGASDAVSTSITCLPSPTADLVINGDADDDVTAPMNSSVNFVWSSTYADDGCFITGGGFDPAENLGTSGSRTLQASAAIKGTYTLTCKKGAQSGTDSAILGCSSTPSTGTWSACDKVCDQDEKGTQTRTNLNANCGYWNESQDCPVPKCRPDGFQEVKP